MLDLHPGWFQKSLDCLIEVFDYAGGPEKNIFFSKFLTAVSLSWQMVDFRTETVPKRARIPHLSIAPAERSAEKDSKSSFRIC